MPRYTELQDVFAAAKPCDILLTNRPRSKISALIRILSGSPVSHAILALGDMHFVMAHRPKEGTDDTAIQKYTVEQLQAEEWDRMFCYRHQALDPELGFITGGEASEHDLRRHRAEAVEKILVRAEDFARDTENYKFATTDLIIGAALASTRPAAYVLRLLERLPRLGEVFAELRRVLDQHVGGEAKLFCSEFVSRCFLDAAATHRLAHIDTGFLVMRHWAAVLSGQERTRSVARRLAGTDSSVLDDRQAWHRLAELDEFRHPEELDEPRILLEASRLEPLTDRPTSTPETPPDAPVLRSSGIRTEDQGVSRGLSSDELDMMETIRDTRDALANLAWPQPEPAVRSSVATRGPDIADFITPVDLLRSPSLRAVAWWDAGSVSRDRRTL